MASLTARVTSTPTAADVHFKNSPKPHPLGVTKEWMNPTHNKVWSDDEIATGLATQPRHKPQLLMEKVLSGGIHTAYYLFNKATGYHAADPTPESIITRLLFLESIAGVPGMVAAQHRHMASLRTMSRDYGWIHTLLEEAENERMHLLTFIDAFDVTGTQRAIVYMMQFGWAAFFIPVYVISPRTAHRTVAGRPRLTPCPAPHCVQCSVPAGRRALLRALRQVGAVQGMAVYTPMSSHEFPRAPVSSSHVLPVSPLSGRLRGGDGGVHLLEHHRADGHARLEAAHGMARQGGPSDCDELLAHARDRQLLRPHQADWSGSVARTRVAPRPLWAAF